MSSQRRHRSSQPAIISVLLAIGAACMLSGCDREVRIESGVYVPVTPPPINQQTPWITLSGMNRLWVDRDRQVVWFAFKDDSLVILPYTALPEDAWPSGCPTNVNSTRMEILDLNQQRLVMTPVAVQDPVLVRDCPRDPVRLALRDRGNTAGGVACTGSEACLVFEWTAETLSLPQSAKGYELYSWQAEADGAWHYTLVTGTNRTKTWAEISTPESTVTGSDWVKITVRETAALTSVLSRLPKDTQVAWIGPGDPRTVATMGEHLEVPNGATRREIEAAAAQAGLQLSTNP